MIQKYGVNAGTFEFKVLDVFLPDPLPESWESKSVKVTFHPFLVVMCAERKNGESCPNPSTAIWLPYWHIEEDGEGKRTDAKYGQYAPLMDTPHFISLMKKAWAKGYFN